MRAVLVSLVAWCAVAGCSQSSSDNYFPSGGGGGDGPGCHADSDCRGDLVCARDGGCWQAADVRVAHIRWTINGAAASADTCSAQPDLVLQFQASKESSFPSFAFAPVPCAEGVFSIDKLPVTYGYVELGDREIVAHGAPIDAATGEAAIDLMF